MKVKICLAFLTLFLTACSRDKIVDTPNSLEHETGPATIKIVTPENNAVINSSSEFIVTVERGEQIKPIQCDIDFKLLKELSAAPFSFTWNSNEFCNGIHILTISAWDTLYNVTIHDSITVTIHNPIQSFTDIAPDAFNKSDYSVFEWEKLPVTVDSDYFRFALTSQDHLFLCDGDVKRSKDHGLTWETIRLNSFGECPTKTIFIDQNDSLFVVRNCLLKSGDYGNTWMFEDYPFWASAFLKTNTGAIVWGGFNEMYRSTDYGKSYEQKFTYYGMPLTCIKNYKNMIFAGTEIDGVICSRDDGNTWEAMNGGIQKGQSGYAGKISDIEYNPVTDELFAAVGSFLYKLDSSNNSWTQLYNVYTRIEAFAFDSKGNLYVAGNMAQGLGMLFKSFDNNTFQSTNTVGNEEHAYIKDIVINSADRPFICSTNGVYRLRD